MQVRFPSCRLLLTNSRVQKLILTPLGWEMQSFSRPVSAPRGYLTLSSHSSSGVWNYQIESGLCGREGAAAATFTTVYNGRSEELATLKRNIFSFCWFHLPLLSFSKLKWIVYTALASSCRLLFALEVFLFLLERKKKKKNLCMNCSQKTNDISFIYDKVNCV